MSGSGSAQTYPAPSQGDGELLGVGAPEERPHIGYGVVGGPCLCPRCMAMRGFYGGLLRDAPGRSTQAGSASAGPSTGEK